MKKLGFTLIELLAVILILGIIALIAIPTVNNIIKESKRGAFKSSVQNIVKAVEMQCEVERIKGGDMTEYYIINEGKSTPELDVKGSIPNNGIITVNSDCGVSISAGSDQYSVNKPYTDDQFEIIDNKLQYTSYEMGNSITYDAGDGTVRTWYVIKDSNDSNPTIDVILNMNYGTGIDYCLSTSAMPCGADGAKSMLPNSSSWSNVHNIRLIKYDDYMLINEKYSGNPSWLIGNLNTPTVVGYWMEDSANYNGNLWARVIINHPTTSIIGNPVAGNTIGVRPVITIFKTDLD